MTETLESLSRRVRAIEERNMRVEADKAWETSKFRVGLITLFTYFLVALLLYVIRVPNYFLAALVPALGFFLSTLTLPFIKEWWIQRTVASKNKK